MLYGYTTLIMHYPIVDVGVSEVLETKKWAFYVSFVFEIFVEVLIHCYYFSCSCYFYDQGRGEVLHQG